MTAKMVIFSSFLLEVIWESLPLSSNVTKKADRYASEIEIVNPIIPRLLKLVKATTYG